MKVIAFLQHCGKHVNVRWSMFTYRNKNVFISKPHSVNTKLV